MDPSLESCLTHCWPLAPFPTCLLPLEVGQSLVMCGGHAPPGPGEGVGRTAALEHPPWGRAPKDAHYGEGTPTNLGQSMGNPFRPAEGQG